MLSWPGFAASRARATLGLFLTLLALVAATTGVIAGVVGYTSASATEAARASVSGSDDALRLRTRLAPDPDAQERAARDIITTTFSPAPVLIETETDGGAVTFVVSPDVRRLAPTDLASYADGADRLRLELRASEVAISGITIEGDLARAASVASQNLMVSRALGAIPLSVLVLVTVLAVLQVARLLAASRETQLALLVARGAIARQVFVLGFVESTVAVSIGALAGTGAAVGSLRFVPEGAGHWRTVLATGGMAFVVTLAIVVSLLVMQVRRVVTPGYAVDRSGRASRAVTGVTLALVLVAATVSLWQFDRAGSPLTVDAEGRYSVNLVAGAAPALLLAAAGVASLGLLGPLGAAAAAVARRSRGAAAFLTAAQVTRRVGTYAVPVILTVLATGAATMSAAYSGTSAALRDDMVALADGAQLRAELSSLPRTPAGEIAPPLRDQLGVVGLDAAAAVWLVDSASIGDLTVPATAVVPEDFAAVASGPVDVPPEFASGAGAGESLLVPEGATGLVLDLDGELGYDRWGLAYLEALTVAWRDSIADGRPGLTAGEVTEELEPLLAGEVAAVAEPVRLSASVSVRDLDSGLGQRVELGSVTADGPVVRWDRTSQSGFTAEPRPFTGALELDLHPGRRYAVDTVRFGLDSPDPFGSWPRTVELRAALRTVEGTPLFGAQTASWASSEATTPELAADALAEQDAQHPEIRWVTIEETGDQEIQMMEHNSLPLRPRLDTTHTAWVLDATTADAFWGSIISPAATPGGPRAADPPGAPTSAWETAVVLTTTAAQSAALETGDSFRMQLMNRSIPARVVAVVDAIPGETRPVAALVDVVAVATTLAVAGETLRPPSELWAATSSDPDEVARSLSEATGGAVRVAGAETPTDPTRAARTIFWVASGGAILLAVTGIAAATRAMTGERRPEVAVLRALGMPPREQARSRAAELAGVVSVSVVFGLVAGWAVSAIVVPSLARSTITPGQVQLTPSLLLHATPWAALLVLGAIGVGGVLVWVARRVRAEASDAEYREEVR